MSLWQVFTDPSPSSGKIRLDISCDLSAASRQITWKIKPYMVAMGATEMVSARVYSRM